MSFLVGILTFFMVINCLLLILLVLVQLPKKDAGVGMAFGAGTADALFGSGSGNALTKITKYATGIFLVLALILGYLQDNLRNGSNGTDFTKKVDLRQSQAPITAPPPAAPAPSPGPSAGNNLLSSIPMAITNALAGTNTAK